MNYCTRHMTTYVCYDHILPQKVLQCQRYFQLFVSTNIVAITEHYTHTNNVRKIRYVIILYTLLDQQSHITEVDR